MPSHDEIVSVIHAYVQAFEDEDPKAAAALFAADAEVEDPVGSPARVGAKVIGEFYADVIERRKPRLELQGPVRTTGHRAAFPMTSTMVGLKHGPMRIDIIDIFEFDEAGKIKSMKAYWGPENIQKL